MSHLQIDDIIAFHSPYNWDAILIHRVVEHIDTSEGIVLRTKGDANPVRDPWTLQEEYVIGLVVEYGQVSKLHNSASMLANYRLYGGFISRSMKI